MNRLYLFDLLRMQEFMEQNFRKPIDAEDIAQFVGYSSWHCRRIFEQYMNETLSGRLRRYRLEAAKQILRNGATEKETALSVGFTTREGFSKAFRSAYGISPGKYARGAESKERFLSEECLPCTKKTIPAPSECFTKKHRSFPKQVPWFCTTDNQSSSKGSDRFHRETESASVWTQWGIWGGTAS